MCTQSQLAEILDRVVLSSKEIFEDALREVVLFGSYARGDQTDESDIDILVVADVSLEELADCRSALDSLSSDLFYDYGILVSIVERDYDTFHRYSDILPFYKNIAKEGVKIA